MTNTHNAQTAYRANTLAAEASQLGAHVIYTRQVLDPDQLTARQYAVDRHLGLCKKGSWEAELFVEPVRDAVIVTKPRFDVWRSQEFLNYLGKTNIDGLVIAGVELRCCVLFAALGADEQGYSFVVPQDLVSGQDGGDGTYNDAARNLLTELYHSPSSSHPLLDAWSRNR